MSLNSDSNNLNKTSPEKKETCTFIRRRGSKNRRKKNLKTKRNIDEISKDDGIEGDLEQRKELEEAQHAVKKRRLGANNGENTNDLPSAEGTHSYAANRGQSDSKQRAAELSTSERQTDGPQDKKKRSSYIHGPVKQNTNIRTVTYYDYQPDICKDYKETGYCGYGDNCKFAHIREDYKSGWMLDRDFEQKQKRRKEQIEKGLSIDNNGSESDSDEDSDDEDDLPFACYICREEFKDPVVTTCEHYFCSDCIMKEYQSGNTKCPICLEPTNGIFNTAENIVEKQKKAKAKQDGKRSDKEDEAEREAKLFSKVAEFEKENQQFRPSASDWMIPSDFNDQRKGGSAGL